VWGDTSSIVIMKGEFVNRGIIIWVLVLVLLVLVSVAIGSDTSSGIGSIEASSSLFDDEVNVQGYS